MGETIEESYDLESVIVLKESGILLLIEIRNPSATDIWNPVPRIQNPRLSWITFYEAWTFF